MVLVPRSRSPLPRRPRQNTAACDSFPISGNDVVLLSCFDGIATGAKVLSEMLGTLSLMVPWEIDPACIAVSSFHFPKMVHRGDFLKDNPEDVCALVQLHDPSASKVVFLIGAPPCPDFSTIRADSPGRTGPEGQKFTAFCRWARKLEDGLAPRRILWLVENVVLSDRGEVDFFSKELQCDAVLVDSADIGVISRPRLWWSRIPWCSNPVSPITGGALRWSKAKGHHQVHIDGPSTDPRALEGDGLRFSDKVREGKAHLPCMTTPAPSDAGRSAPKKMRGRIPPDAKARWLQHGRQFAP